MGQARELALLGAAAELEAEDTALAADLRVMEALRLRVAEVHGRAQELASILSSAPAQIAAVDVLAAEAADAHRRAVAELAESEQLVSSLEASRRSRQAELEEARREQAARAEAAHDANLRVARLESERASLEDAVRSARAEQAALALDAQGLGGDLAGLSRLSASGRSTPGEALDELVAWGERALAALLVASSQLETERERIVREANELGQAVLGEQLGGSSASVVRRRLEAAVRAGSGAA